MRGLGFDPGAKAGWGGVDLPAIGARAQAFACGVIDAAELGHDDQRVAFALDLMMRYQPDVIGVEAVEFVVGRDGFGPHMAGHLLRAARLGSRIYQAAIDHGFAAEEVTAEAWRRWLVGSPQAKNPAIGVTIRTRVAGWPDRSNNHERDGAGVALFVVERALRRARGLPV